jgi:hypothetical protein
MIKTEADICKWVHEKLAPFINDAIKGTIYKEDWLGAMVIRETGGLIKKHVNAGKSFDEICSLMRGDYSNGKYHGFSFFQIDIRSFPEFINSGLWINPQASAKKAVDVLEDKRKYLLKYKAQLGNNFDRAITAAYNSGQGSVARALLKGFDVDKYTAHGNYSADVFRIREIYSKINE